jgi:hypothetical protein
MLTKCISDDWDFRPAEVGFGLNLSFQNLLLEDQINIRSGINNSTSIDPALQNSKIFLMLVQEWF